jgi:predicted ribosomally synthesized peptide with SipW-like signal peptide
MDKKILASMLVIGVVSILLGAGTVAYFSDTETSSGNVFQAGTGPDLQIKDGGYYWSDGIGAVWTLSDMKPGHSVYGSIDLRNVGSSADHLEITCDYTINDPPGPESDTEEHTPADHMAKQMIITLCDYYDDTWLINCLTGTYTGSPPTPPGYTESDWKIDDVDKDGKITLYDLKNNPLDNLPPPVWITHFDMTLKFSEDAGNDFQGDIFDVTMIFTLKQ